MLLGEGGSVNITDNHGNTPLHLACSNGHEEVRGGEGRGGEERKEKGMKYEACVLEGRGRIRGGGRD